MTRCIPPLLSGTYSARFINRATGATRTIVGGQVAGKFTRKLDTTSTADLTLSPINGCCRDLPEVRVDELEVTRDDGGIAWVGPVTRVIDDQASGEVTVSAEDRTYWWQGADFDHAINYDDSIDPVTLAQLLIDAAERYQASGLVIPTTPPLAALAISAKYEKGSSLWSAFVGLADKLIDFTVVGDQLWWGGPEVAIEDGPALFKSRDWRSGALSVDRDGGAVCTQVVVYGSGSIVGVWPETNVDAGYGKRTLFDSNTNLSTDAEALAAAKFTYEANSAPSNFMSTGSGTLSSDAPVCVHDLVPGRKFAVYADNGCLVASEQLRLSNVVVDFQSGLDCAGRWALVESSIGVDFARVGSEGTATKVST